MHPEFPEVPAALAQRAETLQTELARLELAAAQAAALPRLFLLEDEYKRAILSSELDWVRTLVTDLDTSTLQWDQNWVACQVEKAGRQHHPRWPG